MLLMVQEKVRLSREFRNLIDAKQKKKMLGVLTK